MGRRRPLPGVWAVLKHLAQLHPGGALDVILRNPAHWLFGIVGIVPAAAQYAVMRLRGGSSAPDMTAVAANNCIYALVLSFAGLACLVLVYAVARRSGAGRLEALFAAFFMASSTNITIYSRHLLPYDLALAFALLALWLGMKREPGVVRSLVCGLVAYAAFATYYGYWLLVGVVLAVHVLWVGWMPKAMLRRAIAASTAFVFPLIALQVLSTARRLPSFIGAMRGFSRTVTQGEYSEGWSLPSAYLWHSEHLLFVLWLTAAVLTVTIIRQRDIRQRGATWLAALAAIYAGLVLTSVGLHLFVVYGRNARQMVPFFCLAAAAAMAALLRKVRRHWAAAAATCVIMIVGQAAWNLRQPLAQRFPIGVSRKAAQYAPLRHASSFGEGTPILGDCKYNANNESQNARYVLMNTCLSMPIFPGAPPPSGSVIFSFPHPLQYKPYQYEGYTPRERATLRLTDGSMRLIDTASRNGR